MLKDFAEINDASEAALRRLFKPDEYLTLVGDLCSSVRDHIDEQLNQLWKALSRKFKTLIRAVNVNRSAQMKLMLAILNPWAALRPDTRRRENKRSKMFYVGPSGRASV